MTHIQCCLDDAHCFSEMEEEDGGRAGAIEREREREGERDTDTRSSHGCVYTSSFSHCVSGIHSHIKSTHKEFVCVFVTHHKHTSRICVCLLLCVFERERARAQQQQSMCVYIDCNTVYTIKQPSTNKI